MPPFSMFGLPLFPFSERIRLQQHKKARRLYISLYHLLSLFGLIVCIVNSVYRRYSRGRLSDFPNQVRRQTYRRFPRKFFYESSFVSTRRTCMSSDLLNGYRPVSYISCSGQTWPPSSSLARQSLLGPGLLKKLCPFVSADDDFICDVVPSRSVRF
jgi:hypothetical protein